MAVDVSTLGWGTVQDPAGNVVPSAAFTVVNGVGATVLSGVTDANGQIPGSLAEGTYTLTVSGAAAVAVDVVSGGKDPRRRLNVKDFGAVGDGSTNDTAAFQAWVAALGGELGGEVPSTASHYKLTDEITIPASTEVAGGGHVKQYTAEKNVFIAGGDHVSIRGLRLEGNGGTGATDFTKNNGVYANGRKGVTVEGCRIHGFQAAGVQLRECTDYQILGNRIWGASASVGVNGADIIAYSSTAGKRSIIAGNLCLSNNDFGIVVNELGFDGDFIIANNIVVAMDSTLTAEVVAGSLVRRHGIFISYNGGTVDGVNRCIVNGNLVRNTNWFGIYAIGNAATFAGSYLITANHISHVALNKTADGGFSYPQLRAGIQLAVGGRGDIVANNIVEDVGVSGSDVTDVACAKIVRQTQAPPFSKTIIQGNVFRASFGSGLLLKNVAGDFDVLGNHFLENVGRDIDSSVTGGGTTNGAITIRHNRFVRINTTARAVHLDLAASTRTCVVSGNYLVGAGTTAGAENVGIYFRNLDFIVTDNFVTAFATAIYCEPTITPRIIDFPRIDHNTIKGCTAGIFTGCTGGQNGCVVYEGNVFSGVTTRIDSGGFGKAGFEGYRIGARMVICDTNATTPAFGTWIVGDRCEFTTPTAGGNIGSVCTTAGAPGTWKTYGAVAA